MPPSDWPQLLLPIPQQLEVLGGVWRLPEAPVIVLSERSLWPLGQRLCRLLEAAGLRPQCRVGGRGEVSLSLQADFRPEAYQLRCQTELRLAASSPAGLFYALMTLQQLLRLHGRTLPCLVIQDGPDFAARGVMLDISRDKVPTLATLKQLIPMLAEVKINQLQLYMEHTFAYQGHETVWADASPLTPQDVLELDACCAAHFIELVPNQNSFGHMHRWLAHPAYAQLGETGPEGFELPGGERWPGAFSLCPVDPGSLALIGELFEQLLPHFSSGMVNVGADETFDLGQGRSRQACAERGRGRVYLDYLSGLQAIASRHGRLMQFWGDIILRSPELIAELPRPCLALAWGYEAEHPFAAEAEAFARAEIPFYVCPGTSAWNSLGGRSDNMRQNLIAAASAGRRCGAAGYLITDWGDNGHWQTLPVSWPGLACGAAMAWAGAANAEAPLARQLDWQLFHDHAGVAGETWLELGTVYRLLGLALPNQALPFSLLRWPELLAEFAGQLRPDSLEAALAVLDRLIARSRRFDLARDDAGLIGEEFRLSAGLIQHSLRLSLARLPDGRPVETLPAALRRELAAELASLLETYRRVWLQRNRPGGLPDSLAALEGLLTRYLQEEKPCLSN